MTKSRILGSMIFCILAAFTAQAQNPTPPFTQCAAAGLDTSCRILIVIGANGGQRILTDPNVSPTYDGSDDTLIGVVNLSSNPVSSIPLVAPNQIFGFDGDGICSASIVPNPPGCPFGATGYEGPGVSFSHINPAMTSGLVQFNPPIAANGGSAYFGLEMAIPTSCPDADGDGLCDDWEINGLNVIVNGTPVFINLPAMGADPNHKDIFVQADYMVSSNAFCLPLIGCIFGHTHKLQAAALALVTQAFANAPVNNPDGTTGITLHVDCGSDCIMNPKTNLTWGALSQAISIPEQTKLGAAPGGVYDWTTFDTLKTPNFIPTGRQQVFHYVVFGHDLGGLDGTSGISRGIGASDFLVTLGSWNNQVGTTMQQAGTFMHELGHNLNLQHGGTDGVNYKPDYLSIMNYLFQMPGLVVNGAQGTLDYSRFALPGLNENALNENVGLNGGAAAATYGTSFFCQGAAASTLVLNGNSPIDWNCNGNATEPSVVTDINQDGTKTTLTTFNDWPNLVYNGGGVGGLGLALNPPQTTSATPEVSPTIDSQITKPLQVMVSSPGVTRMFAGTSTTLTFTISNSGTINDTYALTASSTAPWGDLTGVPSSLSVSAGASVKVNIPVMVPNVAAVGATGSFSIKAVSGVSPSISDTGTASIAIVAIAITVPPVDGRLGVVYGPLQLTAAGGTPPYTWSATGLPTGLLISPAGVVTGTPTATGPFNATIRVTDSTTTVTASQSFAITIVPAATVTIANASLPAGQFGQPYGPVAMNATGGTGPYSWWATDLPPGVSINPASGLITGNVAGAGQYSVSVTATDSTSASASQSYAVTVATGPVGPPPPTILLPQTITFAAISDHLATDPPFQLSATASSGLPVTFSIASGPATISGNTLTITGLGAVTVLASQTGSNVYAAATASQTFNVTLGAPTIVAVENAASFKAGPLAAGSFAVIFGNNLASGSALGDDRSAQKLDGTNVMVTDSTGNSYAGNLSYVSYGQINFVVPAQVAVGSATVSVVNGIGSSASFAVTIAADAPAIFTADSSGSGVPAAQVVLVAADGTTTQINPYICFPGLGCSAAPIDLSGASQAYLILYGTGIRGRSDISAVKVTLGGQPAAVVFAGPQPTFPGLDQVNVLLPSALAGAGSVNLAMTVDGISANVVKLAFK
jgi:uncharacterized protein (TIGR03437 family)